VEATLEVNQRQASEVFRMLTEEIGELEGKRIALLGLAFKPGTDDVRESRASLIAREVIEAGADIVGFDPLVKDQFVRTLPVEHRDHFHRAPSIDAALDGAHAVVIQNESPAFRSLRPSKVKLLLKKPIVVDGRRILDPAAFRRAGVVYRGIGVGKR
jgi:UDP-glucose 6-dehydrogenase